MQASTSWVSLLCTNTATQITMPASLLSLILTLPREVRFQIYEDAVEQPCTISVSQVDFRNQVEGQRCTVSGAPL